MLQVMKIIGRHLLSCSHVSRVSEHIFGMVMLQKRAII